MTSDLWVSALLRRVFNAGGFGAVGRRGAAEAGAIFVVVRMRDGRCRLFAPAAQASYEEGSPVERRFAPAAEFQDDEALAGRLEKEARFDSDLWVIEIEADEAVLAELLPVTTP